MNPIDREVFLRHLWDLLMLVLLHPQTHLALLCYFAAGGLVLAIALAKAHGLASTGSNSIFLGFFCGGVCVFGMMATTALLQMYAIPYIPNANLRIPGLFAGILAAFLLMIIPFTRMWFRSGYGATFAAWILALLLGALTVFGLKQVYDPKPKNPDEALRDFESFGSQVEKDLKKEIRERVGQPHPEP